MARYSLTITVTGNNINTVKNKLKATFNGVEETSFHVEKIETDLSRSQRLGEAEGKFEDAKSTVEELRDETQEWHDGIPENLQSGSKAEDVQSAIDSLEEILSNMEDVDFSSVDFPSMM